MSLRQARWFAIALVAFLLAQPISLLALALDSGDAACCCKGMSASCCRRSHRHGGQPDSSGPAFSSRDCCGQCQIAVSRIQPVAAIAAAGRRNLELAPAVAPPPKPGSWTRSTRHDAALFERPPPSTL